MEIRVYEVDEEDLRPLVFTRFINRDLKATGFRTETIEWLSAPYFTALIDDLVDVLRKFDQLHLKAYSIVPACSPVNHLPLDQYGEACGLEPGNGHVLFLYTGEVFRAMCTVLTKHRLL